MRVYMEISRMQFVYQLTPGCASLTLPLFFQKEGEVPRVLGDFPASRRQGGGEEKASFILIVIVHKKARF